MSTLPPLTIYDDRLRTCYYNDDDQTYCGNHGDCNLYHINSTTTFWACKCDWFSHESDGQMSDLIAPQLLPSCGYQGEQLRVTLSTILQSCILVVQVIFLVLGIILLSRSCRRLYRVHILNPAATAIGGTSHHHISSSCIYGIWRRLSSLFNLATVAILSTILYLTLDTITVIVLLATSFNSPLGSSSRAYHRSATLAFLLWLLRMAPAVFQAVTFNMVYLFWRKLVRQTFHANQFFNPHTILLMVISSLLFFIASAIGMISSKIMVIYVFIFCVYQLFFTIVFWQSGWRVRRLLRDTVQTLPSPTTLHHRPSAMMMTSPGSPGSPLSPTAIGTVATTAATGTSGTLRSSLSPSPSPVVASSPTAANSGSLLSSLSPNHDIRHRTADRISILAVGTSLCCLAQVILYCTWANMMFTSRLPVTYYVVSRYLLRVFGTINAGLLIRCFWVAHGAARGHHHPNPSSPLHTGAHGAITTHHGTHAHGVHAGARILHPGAIRQHTVAPARSHRTLPLTMSQNGNGNGHSATSPDLPYRVPVNAAIVSVTH